MRLLLAEGARVNMRDYRGETALTWIAHFNDDHMEIAAMLRAAGARE